MTGLEDEKEFSRQWDGMEGPFQTEGISVPTLTFVKGCGSLEGPGAVAAVAGGRDGTGRVSDIIKGLWRHLGVKGGLRARK